MGRRRASLGLGGRPAIRGRTTRSWPRHTRRRCGSTRRCARADDAAACLAALLDGTADAIATDHAPHTEVDKAVEFGAAANGISGIETALGLLLAAVDAGCLPLARAIEALTTGPAARPRRSDGRAGSVGLVEGAPADLVVFDRSEPLDRRRPMRSCRVARTRPLLGMELPGRVLVTLAGGRIAYEAPDA